MNSADNVVIEVDGGDLSNMPSHLVESERRMAKEIAYDNQTRPGKPWASPKLRQIGRFPTEGLITAVCLMGEDRLVRGFAAFTERQNRSTVEEQALCFREFYQKATFASWWFEVAAHMGSREAALYLTRLCTHPYLRNFWRESQIAGPTLDLPRGMIQNEVTTNAETCSWPDFSTYMDLFYSADDLQKASNRGDAHYFLLGIANMRYRIKHNLFEHLDTKLHQPRIHPPHKHLLRIINHCLQKRSPVLEGYPKERLQEIRQMMLQELAEKFDDFEANFILAIEQGDWNSQDFKRYLSRSISPKSKLEHHGEHFYPFHHHAIWLSTLQQLQEVGVLAEKAASTSLVANVHSVASSTESDEDSEPPAFLPLDSRLSEALIYEAEVSEEKSETFFYDRALAATAIIQTISVFPGQAALYLNELIDSVKSNYLLEKKPRLRSQVKKLEEILQKDFGTSGYESMTGWQDKKIDEILQKSANPWDIIRSLQRQIVK